MINRLGRGRKTSLHTGLMLAVVAICAALLALDGWRTWQARDSVLADDKAETANLARSLAQHAHDTIQAADTILLGLRERVAVDGLTPVSLQRLNQLMMARVKALPLVHGLFLYDSEGNWLATSLETAPAGLNNSDREYFQHHRAVDDASAYIGPAVRSKSDGKWIFTISRRVNDAAGRFAGVVLATISVDNLNAFYATFEVGSQGVITLATLKGSLVARKNAANPEIGTDLSKGQLFREFIPHAPVGSFRYTTALRSFERLGSYRRIEGYPLVMVVAHGFDEVLDAWRTDAGIHLAIDLILVAALLGLGNRFARQIDRHLEMERQYRLLADNSSDAIVCTSVEGRRLYVSPAFTNLLGWSAAEALQRQWKSDVHPDDWATIDDVCTRMAAGEEHLSVCYRYVRRSGALLWTEAHIRLIPDRVGQAPQFVINIRDISERKLAEDRLAAAHRQLAVQATTDALTGLANRRRFDEALQQEWQRAARQEQPLSLLLIDADRFKLFNDQYGHPSGDECLKAIATAIESAARRPADIAARYGGEEFVMLLPDTDASGAAQVAEAIRSAIEAKGIEHAGNRPFGVVTGSIGIATQYPRHDIPGCHPDALIAAADSALYRAKHTGRNQVMSLVEIPTSPIAPVLADEAERVDVVEQYVAALDVACAESLDQVARLAATLFQVPIALVSLVGKDKQSFLGKVGLEVDHTSRDVSFCAHAIGGAGVFTVPDATLDPRFAENPLVTGDPGIRFYAGAPLVSPLGQNLGSLCIIDRVPRRPLTSSEKTFLTALAGLAVSYMDRQRLSSELPIAEAGAG